MTKTYKVRKTQLTVDSEGQGWLEFQLSGHPELRSIRMPVPMPQGVELVAAQVCHKYLRVKYGAELADTFIESRSLPNSDYFSQFLTDGELDRGRLIDAIENMNEDARAKDRISQTVEGIKKIIGRSGHG